VDALLQRGLAHHIEGKLAEAELLYREVLQVSPNHADALHLLGVLAYQVGQAALALELIDRAIAARPDFAEAHFSRGNALFALQRYEPAVESYGRAIGLNPLHAEAHCNRGSALLALQQHPAAVESFDKAIQIRPDYADAYANRGNALGILGRYQAAVESYDEVLLRRPDLAEAHYNRGNALYALQQYQAAAESFSKAIRQGAEHAEAYVRRGNALHALGQYATALESYDHAILLNPGFAEAHNYRGSALQALQQYVEALECYERAVGLKPDYADAYKNRGTALHVLGQFRASQASYEKAILLRPNAAESYVGLGNSLHAQQQYLAALESYDKAIELNPQHAEAYSNRGSSLHALQQYHAALESCDKAIQLNPDLTDAYRNQENSRRARRQCLFSRPDYDDEGERKAFAAVVGEVKRIAKIEDKAQMKAELDALPLELRSHPALSNLRHSNFAKTESSGRDLVFFCSGPGETWNPETARTKGVGGSEEAVIWLSRLLHERGWNVTVYATCGAEEKDYEGVWWKPSWMWNSRDRQDVTVLWRYPQFADYEINSGAIVADLHDVVFEEEFTAERLKRIDRIFVKSMFQRSMFPHIPYEKFVVVPNGIDTKLFAGGGERDPMLLINTSSADRSLEAFVDCFEEIKKQVPDAKARWAYGWGVWDYSNWANRELMEWKRKTRERMQDLGMEERGRLSHAEVAELYLKANVFAYPSEFAEIDCISLSKAMAAGAIPVTTDFGAMGDKVGHGGIFLHSKKTKDDWFEPNQFHFEMTDPEQKARFVEEAVKLLRNPPGEKEREPMREWARSTFDWNAVADRWDEELRALLRSQRFADGTNNRRP